MRSIQLYALLAFFQGVAFAARFVAPYEAIYAYLAYEGEATAGNARPTSIAPGCRGSGPNQLCNLNEFLRHVCTGGQVPQATLQSNGRIADIDRAATEIRWADRKGAKWQMEADLLFPDKYDESRRINRVTHQELFGLMADNIERVQRVLGRGFPPDLKSDITSTLTRASEARQYERCQVYLPLFRRALNRVGITFNPPQVPAKGPFPAYRDLDFSHIRAQLSDAQKTTFDDMLRDQGLRQNGKNINIDHASHVNNIRDIGIFRQRAISGPCDT